MQFSSTVVDPDCGQAEGLLRAGFANWTNEWPHQRDKESNRHPGYFSQLSKAWPRPWPFLGRYPPSIKIFNNYLWDPDTMGRPYCVFKLLISHLNSMSLEADCHQQSTHVCQASVLAQDSAVSKDECSPCLVILTVSWGRADIKQQLWIIYDKILSMQSAAKRNDGTSRSI